MSKLFLKIGEVLPNIFVDDPFQIPVFLVDEADKLNCPLPQFNRVTVRVQLEDMPSNLPSSLLEVDYNSCVIRPQGTGQLSLTFRNVSMNFENRRFVIIVSMVNDAREVVGTISTPIFVISQQLVIMEEFSAPYTWYKDEGGKDKYIEYNVFMVDRLGNHVRDKKVALKVTLMYRNGQQVPQQNILTISPDSRLCLDRSGQTTIRVRVNEVSTRHQGQYFQVLIGPDIAAGPSTADVCSVLSTPIDVKSKRNHHKEREKDRDSTLKYMNGSASTGRLDSLDTEIPAKRAKSDSTLSLTNAAGLLETRERDHPVCVHDHNNPMDLLNCTCPQSENGNIWYRKPVSLSFAIGNIVLWAKTVMDAMDAIQWKQIGYSSHTDGAPDLDRPLFNIPNPHESISSVVQQYAAHVKESLQYLGAMTETDMPAIPIAFNPNPDDEKFEDGNMTSLMDIWGSDDAVGMPALMRGISSNRVAFGMDKPNLNRNHSLFLDSDQQHHPGIGLFSQSLDGKTFFPVVELGPPLEGPGEVTPAEEALVQYLVADVNSEFGIPAFDKNKELVGFYKDGKKFGSASSVAFIPVSKYENSPDLHVEFFATAIDNALATNSPALFLRSKYCNDIRRLREDAMIHHVIHAAGDKNPIVLKTDGVSST